MNKKEMEIIIQLEDIITHSELIKEKALAILTLHNKLIKENNPKTDDFQKTYFDQNGKEHLLH